MATFIYFATYPLLRDSVYSLATAGLVPFTILALILPVAALLAPTREWIAAAKVHAALYAAFISVLSITLEPGHSSPADGFAGVYEMLLFAILAFELTLIFLAVRRSPSGANEADGAPWLLAGLTTALLVGWGAGALLWSETVPRRVVTAAENKAGDVPYCLDVVGRPAKSRRDLIGVSMHSPNSNGWVYEFHGLLVIGSGATRSYFNWSYRTGDFEPVDDHARIGLHLDQIAKCEPAPHFALDLAGLSL